MNGLMVLLVMLYSVDFEFPRISSVLVWAVSHVVAGKNDDNSFSR